MAAEDDETGAEASGSPPAEDEHSGMRMALDGIQTTLDEVAATLARMG